MSGAHVLGGWLGRVSHVTDIGAKITKPCPKRLTGSLEWHGVFAGTGNVARNVQGLVGYLSEAPSLFFPGRFEISMGNLTLHKGRDYLVKLLELPRRKDGVQA